MWRIAASSSKTSVNMTGGTITLNGDGAIGVQATDGASVNLVKSAVPMFGAGWSDQILFHLSGAGSQVMADDASPTDRLVIDGGRASGNTAVIVQSAGGQGAPTMQSIRVVQTLNGGTTAADAFRLDASSTGYRQGTGTLVADAYDYSLVRGGHADDRAHAARPSGRCPRRGCGRPTARQGGRQRRQRLAVYGWHQQPTQRHRSDEHGERQLLRLARRRRPHALQ